MIKDNQKAFNRFHVIIDGIILIMAYLSGYYIRFGFLIRFTLFRLDEGERYYALNVYAKHLIGKERGRL